MRKFIRGGAAALVATVVIVLSACSSTSKVTEPFRDARVSSTNTAPAIVVEMPDGFSNFAYKCIKKGIGAAVAFHGDANRAAISLVQDPSCR